MIKQAIYIRYVGVENESELPLNELGESLVGINQSFYNLAKVLRLNDEISLQATKTSEGSFVIDTFLQTAGQASELFPNFDAFLEFAKVYSSELHAQAVEFINSWGENKEALNEFFSKYPFDVFAIGVCLKVLWDRLGKVGKAQKENEIEVLIREMESELPRRVTRELIRLIRNKSFHRALKPLLEDKAKSIEFDTDPKFRNASKITQENFEDYLGEDDQILAHLEDGKTYAFDGEITSIKSTRGDSMTFHLMSEHPDDQYNLDLHPEDGSTTKSYLKFYQEKVHILATVYRKSLYKKPKLKLHKIEYEQIPLDINDERI